MGGAMSLGAALTEEGATGAPSGRLRRGLARSERRRTRQGWLLLAPVLLFLAFTFIVPIGGMLWRSVADPEVAQVLPRTVASLKHWSGTAVPDEASFAALAQDLADARIAGNLGLAAKRLNYDFPGYRALLQSAARHKLIDATPPFKDAFIALDPQWGQVETWGAIARASGPVTSFYLLAAVDLKRQADGSIALSSPQTRIYLEVLLRTFTIGLTVTLLCLPRVANLLMILVLLPFWTSLLVRTTAWIVLLQSQGVVNGVLESLGLITEPIQMIYNRFGVHVAMTHVLLPFMVLPLYSTMRAIPPVYRRAALSLGASPMQAFLRVYLPQTVPGVAAGCLLVFILAIGYYITPALVGGAADQMISYFIAFFTSETANWGMAAALGAVLLVITSMLYWIYSRIAGTGGVKLG
jgi:putative spermidine/putrescine transport system permease protein